MAEQDPPRRRAALVPSWRARGAELFEKVESWGLSAILHLLLLLLFGLVTLGGGGGKGDSVGEGATGKTAFGAEKSAFAAEALEQVLQKEQVKPLRVDLPKPRKQQIQQRIASRMSRAAPTQQLSAAGIGGGYGGGIGKGIGKDFGDFLGLLKRAGFDCVFVIDATGSMQYVIQETTEKIAKMVGLIQRLVPVARVGLVVYRDKGEEFVVRKSNLTFHGKKLQRFLRGVDAGGGGDWEEGLKDGLEAAVNDMQWRRRSKKIIVIVSSSPPHKEDWPAIDSLTAAFKGRGGVISTIDVSEPAHVEFERAWHMTTYGRPPDKISPLPAFYGEIQDALRRIARSAGGEMVALGAEDAIMRELMVVAFGREWESKIAKYAKEL